jgi:hypothetical protein
VVQRQHLTTAPLAGHTGEWSVLHNVLVQVLRE